MAPRDRAAAALIALAALLPVSQAGLAHGYAGDRYFPPTIDIDDPFAAAESHVHAGKRPGDPGRSSVIGAGFGLEPVDGFGIGLDTAHRSPNPNLSPAKDGFDNAILTLKKELVIDDAHEYAITAALVTEVGGTGSEGASGHSTFAPTLFYAKGFGDLPDRLRLLRPFAVTGVLAAELPTDAARPKMLNWGFTVQYSLLYLQSHVGAFGLSAPFDRPRLLRADLGNMESRRRLGRKGLQPGFRSRAAAQPSIRIRYRFPRSVSEVLRTVRPQNRVLTPKTKERVATSCTPFTYW